MFTWIRGSTFKLGIRPRSGAAFTGAETVRCVLKRSTQRDTVGPGDDVPDAVVFSCSFVAASGNMPAYWKITGSAAQSEALAPGWYITDARIVIGGEVTQTTPVKIEVVQRVTEAS